MSCELVNLITFKERHLASLELDEARHNLILGLVGRAGSDKGAIRFWSFGEHSSRCAVQAPPYYIVLGDLNTADCESLAKETKELDFPGSIGPDDISAQFAQALGKFGVSLTLGMPQRIYILNAPPIFPAAIGEGRTSREEDRELYVDWVIAFGHDANILETTPNREDLLKHALSRPVFFWEVDGRPVAMASRTRETKTGTNISMVYTHPEFRGRGFGGSVTAYACKHVFDSGKKMAFLYTDLRNPISNRVYQKIGFVPRCDSNTYVRK